MVVYLRLIQHHDLVNTAINLESPHDRENQTACR